MPRLLQILPLLICLPCTAATVYKSVDARGRVTFSDSPPVQAVSVEKLVIEVQAAADPDLYLQRLAAMTEVTDKIAADRKQREQTRAQSRRWPQDHYSGGRPTVVQDGYTAGYSGYGRFSGVRGRHYRKGHYPSHPIAHPPLLPARGPALVNQYPASLVRRSYSPQVAAIFQSNPAP
ncbi:MAG: DUF4124 domain-containing protein [Gammaproteobacteria bacterium]|nr:DUF4124 domain-containing protein [Gammaproteobacteria bacterium]